MSIQEAISAHRGHNAISQRLINRLNLILQKAHRSLSSDIPKVFYPLKDLMHTHPFFYRFYDYPPLNYSNFGSAQLCHWVNFDPTDAWDVPFVIEPNDHPLSVTAATEPVDAIGQLERASEIYLSDKCRKIIVESEGQLALFKRYFSESVINKTEIVRLGAVPQLTRGDRLVDVDRLTFLCLASDFNRKAVDLLIKAWSESKAKRLSKLVLACHNIPESVAANLHNENIEIITKVPLTANDKFILLSNAHVVIAPYHIDGGACSIEAFEFGLPLITMRSQRSFIRDNNGWEVDVPFYFYDSGYGVEWRTFAEFWELVEDAKRNHLFDSTVQDFVKIFDEITQSPEMLFSMGKVSLGLAKGEFSLRERNAALKKIYEAAVW